MHTPIQLIVGLGNPGAEYHQTRHNAGQDFVMALAQQLGQPLAPTNKFFGYSARATLANNREIRLLVPTTFMNRSGQAIAAISQFYKIPADAILVAHDELDLPPGTARLKRGGGHGGHNGLRDTISALGNNRDFPRLRIGIGHPGSASQVVGYVLQRAPAEQATQIQEASERALAVVEDLSAGEWDRATRNLHSQ